MDLFRGKHILPGDTKDFDRICNELGSSFTGVMRFLGRGEGNLYRADLLIRMGKIGGASFEDLDKKTIVFKSGALNEIKKKLLGSIGSLDIYSLDDKDLTSVMVNNKDAILDPSDTIPLSSLGVRIKPVKKEIIKTSEKFKPAGEKRKIRFGFMKGLMTKEHEQRGRETEELRVKERIEAQATKEPGIDVGEIKGGGSMRKEERLSELRRKRQREEIAIRKKMSRLGREDEEKKKRIITGGKVKTSIDKLLELIQKHKKIRIDDGLARTLNVKRSQIEGWAMILEEHDLVELHYPAIGEPEIRIIDKNNK